MVLSGSRRDSVERVACAGWFRSGRPPKVAGRVYIARSLPGFCHGARIERVQSGSVVVSEARSFDWRGAKYDHIGFGRKRLPIGDYERAVWYRSRLSDVRSGIIARVIRVHVSTIKGMMLEGAKEPSP